MRYMKATESKPLSGVDVHVVTKTGKKGVAKYWDVVGKWLTQDTNLSVTDEVTKWRYEDVKVKH